MLSKELFIQIEKVIPKIEECYAHRNGDKPKETVVEHTKLCQNYFLELLEKQKLNKIFENFIGLYLEEIGEEAKRIFEEMLMNIVVFHDIGKINPLFQIKKMKEKWHEEILGHSNIQSNHAIISAVIYRDYFEKRIKSLEKKEERRILEYFSMINSYVISKHHGNFGQFEEYLNSYVDGNGEYAVEWLKTWIGEFYENPLIVGKLNRTSRKNMKKYFLEKKRKQQIYLYSYVRLTYSILVAADYYATTEFMSGYKTKYYGEMNSFEEMKKVYEETSIQKSIRSYLHEPEKGLENVRDINVLRTEMFLEAENALLKNLDKNIYYLEAPTGSGKSNTAMNLSFQILENEKDIKKLFYIYPFNTLVEQNLEILQRTFGESEDVMKQIAVVNSLYPIKVSEDSSEREMERYQKALLDRQFLNYPFILSTHVSIFETMFSTSKESVFGFHKLANSVIVLDEIQSYRIKIWREIIQFLKGFAELLNIKIIIMSATLPNLEMLDPDKSDDAVRLIKNTERYFQNKLFKDRVKVSYELLDDLDFSEEKLKKHVIQMMKSERSILIEFIKKTQAFEFYQDMIEDNQGYEIFLITGDDNLIERKKIIDKVKQLKKKVMLIATQVIEAGVDIDMEIGYKDSSKIDSEEQFMGRINRSCKNSMPGQVYLFNLTNAKKVYLDDNLRLEEKRTINNEEMRDVLIHKSFEKYYEEILSWMSAEGERQESIYGVKRFFDEKVSALDFQEVEKQMRLIEDNKREISLFLARDITDENGILIAGKEVWARYIELLQDDEMDYAKKRVKLSEVRSQMNNFIYKIYRDTSFIRNDMIGDLYYIEDAEQYFENEKFCRERFNPNGYDIM